MSKCGRPSGEPRRGIPLGEGVGLGERGEKFSKFSIVVKKVNGGFPRHCGKSCQSASAPIAAKLGVNVHPDGGHSEPGFSDIRMPVRNVSGGSVSSDQFVILGACVSLSARTTALVETAGRSQATFFEHCGCRAQRTHPTIFKPSFRLLTVTQRSNAR